MFKVLANQIWLPLVNWKQPFSTFFRPFRKNNMNNSNKNNNNKVTCKLTPRVSKNNFITIIFDIHEGNSMRKYSNGQLPFFQTLAIFVQICSFEKCLQREHQPFYQAVLDACVFRKMYASDNQGGKMLLCGPMINEFDHLHNQSHYALFAKLFEHDTPRASYN